MSCTFPSKRDTRLAATAALDACRDQLERVGVHVGQELGCGLQGCVYEAGEGPDGAPAVLKITCAMEEALFAAWLMKQKNVPAMLPRFFGVWELECGLDAVAAVEAHRIGDKDVDAVRDEFMRFRRPSAVWREALRASQNRDEKLRAARLTTPVVDAMRFDAEGARAGARQRNIVDPAAVRKQDVAALVRLAGWIKNYRVRLGAFDFGADQVGFRPDGTLVLRDLGFAQLPQVEAQGVRVPGLGGLAAPRGLHVVRRQASPTFYEFLAVLPGAQTSRDINLLAVDPPEGSVGRLWGSEGGAIEDTKTFVVRNILVAPQHRRTGVATALYEAAASFAAEQGRALMSDIELSDEALAFWEKQRAAGRARFIRGRRIDTGRFLLAFPPPPSLRGLARALQRDIRRHGLRLAPTESLGV